MFGLSLSVKGGRRLKALSLSIRSTKAFSHTERPTAAAEFDTIEKGGKKRHFPLHPSPLPLLLPFTLPSLVGRKGERGGRRRRRRKRRGQK